MTRLVVCKKQVAQVLVQHMHGLACLEKPIAMLRSRPSNSIGSQVQT